MPIKKRVLVCDCGEQFDENKDDGTVSGNLTYGPWKYKQAKIKEGGNAEHDMVTVYFIRSVDCNKCMSELFREKKCYEVVPSNKPPKMPPLPAPDPKVTKESEK